jgi:hypothetical protein
MESGKIVLLCVVAAIGYGIVHDQVTTRICIEYFTVFHPPVFPTRDPTLLALGWGIIATWWMGAFFGVLLAITARASARPKVAARSLVRPVLLLLGIMAASAILLGFIGYALARSGMIAPPIWVRNELPQYSHAAFMADWWAHNASYAGATLGGIVLCVMTYRKRVNARNQTS